MDLDPVLLSRLQFAWVIGWHILLPAFTIGMASYITILEGLHLVTGRSVYLRISMYWIRVFSVAVGVVTGVIMPFQIGTNWSRYADTAGNVLGPLFAYEALTAFNPCRSILVVVCRAFVDRLVEDRAPHSMKLHHHSGSLFFPLREGRPVQMHLECGGVPVHFVRENFRNVVFRQQDFELQGARFIFQACLVRHQRSYDLISPPWGNLDRDDIGKF